MVKLTRSETIARNKAEKRISASYNRTCRNVQIPMMNIPKIFKVGGAAIAAGADDAALDQAITAYVATIRTN